MQCDRQDKEGNTFVVTPTIRLDAENTGLRKKIKVMYAGLVCVKSVF